MNLAVILSIADYFLDRAIHWNLNVQWRLSQV